MELVEDVDKVVVDFADDDDVVALVGKTVTFPQAPALIALSCIVIAAPA